MELRISAEGQHADAYYIGVGNSIDVRVQDKKGDSHNLILSKAVATQLYKVLQIVVREMDTPSKETE